MRLLSLALLLGVFVANDVPRWLGRNSGLSASAWWYVLQALWVAALSGCLLRVLLEVPRTPARNLAIGAMAISMAEGSQAAVCRLAAGPSIADLPRGVNLCDFVTGWPVGAGSTTLYLMVIAVIVGSGLRHA